MSSQDLRFAHAVMAERQRHADDRRLVASVRKSRRLRLNFATRRSSGKAKATIILR